MSNLYFKTALKSLGGLLLALPAIANIEIQPLVAQSITPANDNTGTIVTPDGQRFDISGGSLSNDGKNLFHSFAEFGLDANQIANFLSNPDIQNILSRINGGNPSVINGLIQVSGSNANLYLMNPAGIIFGKEASLNVAGDFSATTATAIGFEGGWFSAFGNNEYQNLIGNPSSFSFNTNTPGVIINAGDLAIAEGQNLSLVAGSIVNTGSLTASDGGVIISPVPGENLVRISIPGNLLSLEIEPPTDGAGNPIDITPKTLLELIKGSNEETGLIVNENDRIQVADTEVEPVIPASSTSQIIAENIDEPSLFVFTPIDSPTDSPIAIAQDFSQTGVVESFDGLTFNIVPGEEAQISSDNQNLFYTFSDFDLPQSSQTANFVVPSSIKNILARVYNGESSIIRGTIEVTGGNSPNLYLMNPAGIVFGSTARLNVPGDFIATTANGIRLGEEWFSASGSNDYQNLVGDPNALAFQTAQVSEESLNPIQRRPGAIINSADLTNSNGSIEFIAGSIINTGNISTSGDRVRLATVPDDSILNLEDFSLASTNSVTRLPEAWNLAILDFQDLIDDSDFPDAANDLKLNNIASNQVQLSDSGVIVRNGDLAVNNISTNGGEIKLNSGGVKNLITGQIFSSTGNVTTSNLDSSSVTEQAGNITIAATSNINTGNLDSSSVTEETEAGTAGNITLSAINNINTADIAANGSTSGNISFSVGQDQNITAGNISGILGNIDTSGEVTFGDITTPGTDINIGTQIPPESVSLSSVSTNGGNFSVSSSGNVNLTNSNGVVTNGGNITINANSLSGTANLDSSGASGGQIELSTNSSIETGTIDSSGSVGDGGTVTLDASGNIKVSSIDTRGGAEGMGGKVAVSTDSFFQATGTLSESNISITSAGGIGGGEITIQHGGRGVRAFVVGDASLNGTAGVITNGNLSIAEGSFFTDTTEGQEGEQISLLSGSGGEQPQPEPEPEPEPEPQPTIDLLQQAADNSCNLSGDCQQSSRENAIAADSLPVATDLVTRERTREILTDIEAATGVKPAIIYVKFSPKSISVESALTQLEGSNTKDFQERLNPGKAELTVTLEAQDDDRLELLLVNTEGQLIKREVPGTSRKQVIELAEQLRQTVTNPRDAKSFLAPAQQLYRWLIAPLEQDLKAQEIENLVFIMDAGVRSLPVAALHDGNGFIVEKYSVGLMPSLSITDTRYVKVKDLQVLAMGADRFPDQPPLPSVPVELSLITQELWPGKSFLNKGFTVDNLKEERALRPFGILHLATHGEFKPGELNNSYIQFGNTKVGLDKLRQLNLYDPPIELMVLSACRTAVGSEEAEIGFAGLAYQAGVKTALGSLWYVSDEGTLGLMTDFYEELKTAPIKAEALRQAQLAMLRGEVRVENGQLITSGGSFALPPELAWIGNKKLTHPYYWSAFTMIGNPW